MSDAIDTLDFEHGGRKLCLKFFYDEFAESPREYSNLGTMTCFHGRYNLGDSDPEYASPEELHEDLSKPGMLMLPLYLYDHSGITMSTTPFSCPWDSGQVGYIHVTEEKAKSELPPYEDEAEEAWKERVYNALRNEVSDYSRYIEGNVYVARIYDPDTDEEIEEQDYGLTVIGLLTEEQKEAIKQEAINEFLN